MRTGPDPSTWTLTRRATFATSLLLTSHLTLTAVAAWAIWNTATNDAPTLSLAVFAATAALTGLAGHTVIRWLARATATPVTALIDGTHQLRNGTLHHRVHLPDSDREFQQLAAAFNQMAARLEADQKTLAEQARHDELTGLLNRRHGRDTLIAELDRTVRYHRPLTVALLDIDRFKHVNDTYGHPAGDQVLTSITARLRTALRPTDTAIRWGGEEFAVLLPETPLGQGRTVTERLRHIIAAEPVTLTDGTRLRITASFGVAAAPDHSTSPDQLISAADQALYIAKDSGRNQVVCQPAPGTAGR